MRVRISLIAALAVVAAFVALGSVARGVTMGQNTAVETANCPSVTQVAGGTSGSQDVWYIDTSCEVVAIATTGDNEYSPALSADGATVAYVVRGATDDTTRIVAVDVAGGAAQTVIESKTVVGGPAWSPDKGALAYWKDDGSGHPQIFVLNLVSGEETRVSSSETVNAQVTWSPDGTQLAYVRAASTGSQIVVTPPTLDGATSTTPAGVTLKYPSWSGDGQLAAVAIAGGDHGSFTGSASFATVIIDPNSGEVLRRSEELNGTPVAMGWIAAEPVVALAGDSLNSVEVLILDDHLRPAASLTVNSGVPAWPASAAEGP